MTRRITAVRYHDISCGHRVAGHESKCAFLHGHNYRIHFRLEAYAQVEAGRDIVLDTVGRVVDFSVIKEKLCMWLERAWDHKFIAWDGDPLMAKLLDAFSANDSGIVTLKESVVFVPFNPTAENMARYLLDVVAPHQLAGLGVTCTGVEVEETRKCSAAAIL